MTKKVAIVLDSWKLPTFERILTEEGYTYTKHEGLTADTVTLKLEVESVAKVAPVVKRMNEEAARSRRH